MNRTELCCSVPKYVNNLVHIVCLMGWKFKLLCLYFYIFLDIMKCELPVSVFTHSIYFAFTLLSIRSMRNSYMGPYTEME